MTNPIWCRAKAEVGVGRRKRWTEEMQARFAEGSFDSIAAVLYDGEDRIDLMMAAVRNEVARRHSTEKSK